MWKASILLVLISSAAVSAQDRGRMGRPLPSAAEAARLASETVMNDSSLQKGDIVVTDRGLFVFKGVGPDGYTFEFSPVPNSLSAGRSGR